MSPANSAAIATIWQTDFDKLVLQARKKLRSAEQAEDVVMQSFAKLGELMERRFLPDPRRLLALIMQGLIVDTIRTAFDNPTVLVTDLEHDDQSRDVLGAQSYLAVEDAPFPTDFDTAVRALPEQDRDAFILTELRGLTVREAADVLGTSKSDVDRRTSSARTSIRKELAA